MYSIYLILCSDNGLKYIGMTKQPVATRWRQHVSDAKNRASRSMFHRAIRKHGIDKFFISVIDNAESFREALSKESFYINKFDTVCPHGYNLSAGGEKIVERKNAPITNKRIGSTPKTEETRRKISAALSGRKSSLTPEGRKRKSIAARAHRHTPEAKAKIASSKLGKALGPLSPERKAKWLEAFLKKMKGRPFSQDHKLAMSAARIGMKFSDSHRAAIGEASKGRPVSPETREKIAAVRRGYRHTPEAIENMRKAAQERAKKQRGKSHSEEHRRKISESNKRAYAEGRRIPRRRLPESTVDTPPAPRP